MTGRYVAYCPVAGCPQEFPLTDPHVAERGERLVVVVPPPASVPADVAAAGMRAAQQVLSRPVAGFSDVVQLLSEAANAQDDAVIAAHLAGHSRLQLQATFGDRVDEVLARLS